MKEHKSVYTVKDLAKISGLTPYTIRYYCKFGLFGETERNASGVRTFSNNDILILMTILFLKKLHMPLEEIKNFIHNSIVKKDSTVDFYSILERHKKVLHERILQLNRALLYIDNQKEYFKIARSVIDSALGESEDYKNINLTNLEQKADQLLIEHLNQKNNNET